MIYIIIYFVLGIIFTIYRYKKEEEEHNKLYSNYEFTKSLMELLIYVILWPLVLLATTEI